MAPRGSSKDTRPIRNISAPRAKPNHGNRQASSDNDAYYLPSNKHCASLSARHDRGKSAPPQMDESMSSIATYDTADLEQEEEGRGVDGVDGESQEEEHLKPGGRSRKHRDSGKEIRRHGGGRGKLGDQAVAPGRGKGVKEGKSKSSNEAVGVKRKRQSAPAVLPPSNRTSRRGDKPASRGRRSTGTVPLTRDTRKATSYTKTRMPQLESGSDTDYTSKNDSDEAPTDIDAENDDAYLTQEFDEEDADLGSQADTEEEEGEHSRSSKRSRHATSLPHSCPVPRARRTSHHRRSLPSPRSAPTKPYMHTPHIRISRSDRRGSLPDQTKQSEGLSEVQHQALMMLLKTLNPRFNTDVLGGLLGLPAENGSPAKESRVSAVDTANMAGKGHQTPLDTHDSIVSTGLEIDLDDDEEGEDEEEIAFDRLEDMEDEVQLKQQSKRLAVRLERSFDNALSASLTGLDCSTDALVANMEGMMLSLGQSETLKHLETWRKAEEALLDQVQAQKEQLGKDIKASDVVSTECYHTMQRLYDAQLEVVKSFETEVTALFESVEERMEGLREELRKSKVKSKKKYLLHTSEATISKEIEMNVMEVINMARRQAPKPRADEYSEEEEEEDGDDEEAEED